MNFTDAIKEFLSQNALIQLPKLNEKQIVPKLTETFQELLQDAPKREKLAANASAVMKKNRGATAKTIEHLKEFLQ